jgi:hypothetical protein
MKNDSSWNLRDGETSTQSLEKNASQGELPVMKKKYKLPREISRSVLRESPSRNLDTV